jgi:tripartite-type tricarboxylate transporter receptor subunit TctC
MRAPFRQAATPQYRTRPRSNDRRQPITPATSSHPRRHFLRIAAGAAALTAASRRAWAQSYPMRPVRIIVPIAAGGATDILARLMSQWLSERLGQQFIIENRTGGGTTIGTETVAHAPADGYTLLMVAPSAAINATLYEKLNYDFMRDIAPVASIIRNPLVMVVNPSFPARTVSEFVAYAKAQPRNVNMASGGIGTSPHLAGELFKMMTALNMLHVPYRGDAPALTDLIGGQVQVMFAVLPSAIEYVRTGKLRALAVTTATRSEALPDVPTVGETVPGYDASGWYGVGAPKNTPAEVIDKLNNAINAVLADPAMKARLADLGGTPLPMTPAEFGKFIAGETDKWGRVIRTTGIKPE